MIRYLLMLLVSSTLSASSYTEINGEWRSVKEPRIVRLELADMGLGKKGIYEGSIYFEQSLIKVYGEAEFHEETNELYVTYTSQIIGGKEMVISEWAKYIVYLNRREDGLRYVMFFSPNTKETELGMFYFYRSQKK